MLQVCARLIRALPLQPLEQLGQAECGTDLEE